MATDSYYFPHDYNAHNDPKLIKLAMNGWDFIGLYWAVVEMLHEQGGYLNIDSEPIAFALRTDKKRIDALINFPGIFKIKGNTFTCQRVLENLKKREEISKKSRNSALKRWGNAKAMPTHCKGNAIKERKGKEIKGKDGIDIKHTPKTKYLDFVLLTQEEYDKLVAEFGVESAQERIARLNDYIGSKGVKYKSHYHTILTWARKDIPEAGSNLTKTQRSNIEGLHKTMEVIKNDKRIISTGISGPNSSVSRD